MAETLPIEPFRERIVSALEGAGALILTAATGAGKSTQAPRYLMGRGSGRVLVLEPRRLSARSLARRVAQERGSPLGREIGYEVRFDACVAKDTKVVFQTYGVFLRRCLARPELPEVDAVLLDEFHERTLESDLALAWLKALRRSGRGPRVLVMSATLDGGALSAYWPEAARIDVPGRLFPVDVRRQPMAAREEPAAAALRALQALDAEGLDGSVLVFMPGLREIRRTVDALGPFCRARGLPVLALHGSMQLEEQGRALEPSASPRLVVATNVAETGLTIPGVTAVIDSGLHRVAAFDPARGINTLYVQRISRANAEQRAGRAGRTAPGRCVRLWSAAEESGLAASLAPEMLRLELSGLRLEAASLPAPLEWLTPPPAPAWELAGRMLASLGAVDAHGRISPRGRALLRFPASPRLAAVLEDARAAGRGVFERACAMAAVFESAGDRKGAVELFEAGDELRLGEERDREAFELYRRLLKLGEDASGEGSGLEEIWLRAFADRLAVRAGEGGYYRLADGRGAMLEGKSSAPVILALELRERAGGGQARQVSVGTYLNTSSEAVRKAFPGEAAWTDVAEMDERLGRVVHESRLLFRGLALERRERMPKRADRKAAAELWAERFATGELRHPGLDEKAGQLVTRIRVARALYPDLGLPGLDADDWRLIYGELCEGRATLEAIEREPLLPAIERYLGKPLADFLEKTLPPRRALPSGRSGRFTYFEGKPAELSARLGDFVGMKGTLALCEGRLPVVFDILAPNHRTVQKTSDLSSFWANTYPEIKRELKRRYPKHPWP
ncbi:MAG: ATP-dependent helicase HrpB [Elusimicrobia bacterium]|nr:ATP-dependent helicase HrpB [Elusimicrobiota bacterium]